MHVRICLWCFKSRGVNFGGHFGGQNVQVSMLQNGMVTSYVQSAEQIGSKKLAISVRNLNVNLSQFFSNRFVQPIACMYTTRDHSILEHTHLYILPTKMAAEIDAHD